jgi:ABC-type sugar transport system permease subunit
MPQPPPLPLFTMCPLSVETRRCRISRRRTLAAKGPAHLLCRRVRQLLCVAAITATWWPLQRATCSQRTWMKTKKYGYVWTSFHCPCSLTIPVKNDQKILLLHTPLSVSHIFWPTVFHIVVVPFQFVCGCFLALVMVRVKSLVFSDLSTFLFFFIQP